jgi:hypothetical protein
MVAKRILSILGILIGGLGSILALLNAFNIDLTEDQQKSIAGVASLILLVVSAWLNPDVPLGNDPPAADAPPSLPEASKK